MMSEIKEKINVLADGSNFPTLRKMTRGQALEFNKRGLNPMRNKAMLDARNTLSSEELGTDAAITLIELNDEMETWILDTIYSEFNFDNADYQACSVLAAETYKATFFPDQGEIKNS